MPFMHPFYWTKRYKDNNDLWFSFHVQISSDFGNSFSNIKEDVKSNINVNVNINIDIDIMPFKVPFYWSIVQLFHAYNQSVISSYLNINTNIYVNMNNEYKYMAFVKLHLAALYNCASLRTNLLSQSSLCVYPF